MDKFILQAFKNLPTAEVSGELHIAIFRAAAFRRFWRYVSILTFIITLTFFFSLWHLYTRAVEIEAFSAFKAIIGSFELSTDSILDSAKTFLLFLPVQSIIITLLNLIALIFMTFLLKSFSRLQAQFKM